MLFVLLSCEESYKKVDKLSPETRSNRPHCQCVVTLLHVFENTGGGQKSKNHLADMDKKVLVKIS